MSLPWIALILGVVEGLTEFLPISSTGHLILTSSLLDFKGRSAELFEVFIQLGAVLSVVFEYRDRLNRVALDLPRRAEARRFAACLLLGFLPVAVAGFLFHDAIYAHLFTPVTVAAALIVGGVLILVVEALPLRVVTKDAEAVSWWQALSIGLAQCLALWPGFSRSAATILGGMGAGLDRRAATEFSFFLAVPTMMAATYYSLFVNLKWLEPGQTLWLLIAFAVSFVVARLTIRWLLRYVSNHSFRPFAWYRLVLGALILVVERS